MARIRRGLSLRARLLWAGALAAALIIGAGSLVEKGLIDRAVERQALDAAGATALGVAADITERDDLPTPNDLEDLRVEFAKAEPSVRALTITQSDGDQQSVVSSTDPRPPHGARALAQRAVREREIVVSEEQPNHSRFVAVPLERDHRPYGAVVVTMSMELVEGVRRQTRIASLCFVAAAVLLLTVAIDALLQRLVHAPLAVIHETMARTAAGDLQARVKVQREDELGALAEGLNAMLERLGDFNSALQAEVAHATSALQDRQHLLLESNRKLFAARRELAKSEQLAVAGQMAASVAHQIGTPLNLISGYVQMMLAETTADSPLAARLRTVQGQIGRVTGIVQGLLDQARPPALARAPLPPAELLSEVVEVVRPTLDARGITLNVDLAPGLPLVSVDRGQWVEVFLNLITNSIDAIDGEGSVDLKVRAAADQVEFDVSDSGSGIAPENLARVFDPLFTTKRPGQGTGLGLAIVRDVVSAHGGTVSLRSQPGKGTTVTVRLPRVAAPAAIHA